MSSLKTSQYQKAYVNEPSSQLKPSENHGRKRTMNASIVLAAEVALNDTIEVCKLPAGAKLLDARIVAPSDGTSGQFDLGWLDNGSDGADQDGIFAGATEVDSGAGAVDAKMLGSAPGYGKEFSKETEIQAFCVEATTASNGDEIKFELTYVID